MSKLIYLHCLVEGRTEKHFIDEVLSPYLANKGIFVQSSETTTSSGRVKQKGGDIRFSRIKREISIFLKQRPELYVSTFVDYYGIKEWPGTDSLPANATPSQISEILNEAAISEMVLLEPELRCKERYIPFLAMHEFEAFLFSAPEILEREIGASSGSVKAVLDECGTPEQINTGIDTAPSKRIIRLANIPYHKATNGVDIARIITIDTIREQCPLFDAWLKRIENLTISI